MSAAVTDRPLTDRATEALRRAGNPFRNYFARNPDDEVCARYHVAELFAAERDLLLGVVDLYRYDPTTHSEVVPVLGNKGAGKTHLLHSIKHGTEGAWQLLVTPGVTSSCHWPPTPCLIECNRWVLPAPLLPSTGTTSEWVIGS